MDHYTQVTNTEIGKGIKESIFSYNITKNHKNRQIIIATTQSLNLENNGDSEIGWKRDKYSDKTII